MMRLFIFDSAATTDIYTLSLHDALPICLVARALRPVRPAPRDRGRAAVLGRLPGSGPSGRPGRRVRRRARDRKSTRLNSSHANISYAVFCLKKKTPANNPTSFFPLVLEL